MQSPSSKATPVRKAIPPTLISFGTTGNTTVAL